MNNKQFLGIIGNKTHMINIAMLCNLVGMIPSQLFTQIDNYTFFIQICTGCASIKQTDSYIIINYMYILFCIRFFFYFVLS